MTETVLRVDGISKAFGQTVALRQLSLAAASLLAVSAALQMHVEEHRALNPGGVLPTVLGVPLLLCWCSTG